MDSLFLYIESNGIFIILLLVLFINMRKNSIETMDERLYTAALILNIGVLIADTGCWMFDGRIFGDTLLYNKLVYCVYYLLTAAFVFVWYMYIVYRLRVSWNCVKRYISILMIPVAVALILSIVSIWDGCLYSFDDKGVYIRGNLFAVHAGVQWFYLTMSLIPAAKIYFSNRRDELFHECMAILMSVVFPIVGGILQTVYYGFNMAWTGSSVSFVIIFISVQNRQIVTDALTGIHNRGNFEKYLRDVIEKGKAGENLYLVMIDINKFKLINDKYGHTAGDKALVEIAKRLYGLSEMEQTDYLARYGGDEFVFLCWRKMLSRWMDLCRKYSLDVWIFRKVRI